MSKLTTKKNSEGMYEFYWNGNNITGLWMDFFSGLPMKDEKHCNWIFARRYTKELDKEFPPNKSALNIGDSDE